MDSTQQHRLWYQPQDRRSAVDAIENIKFIIAFLSDTLAQESTGPGEGYRMSEAGATGLYQIYSIVENVLDDCIDKILKEAKK